MGAFIQVAVVLDSDNVVAAITWQNQRLELKVSFHAVCLASKVWKRFLLHPRLVDGMDLAPQGADDAEQLDNMEDEAVDEPESQSQNVHNEDQGHEDAPLVELCVDNLVGDNLDFIHKTSGDDEVGQRAIRKVLDFTADDPEAILPLLQIAHLQFDKIPTFLGYQQLVKVARLCDYYECVRLVRPFSQAWLEYGQTESKRPGQEEWLFIAWVFGREKLFTELAANMVREVGVNESGQCVTSTGKVFDPSLPPLIIESILDVRQATITKLLEVPYKAID